jgi:transcriptional regulator with XRE-family HTH domain
METLAQLLVRKRAEKRLSLRQVQAATGIQNAHLSQIETGAIRKPELAVLWDLAQAYDVDYRDLMSKAGYLSGPTNASGVPFEVSAAALRSIDELSQDQLLEVVEYVNKIKERTAERA